MYGLPTSYPLRVGQSVVPERVAPPRGRDESHPIRINLTKSPSTSVGARVAGRGGEGLYGRPRSPVWLTTGWVNVAERDGGRPQRPSHPPHTPLAPTCMSYQPRDRRCVGTS